MNRLVVMVFVSVCLVSGPALSGEAPDRANQFDWEYFGIPGLDQAQKTRLDQIRIAYAREFIPLHFQIHSAEASARVLLASVPIDQNAWKASLERLSGLQVAWGGIEARLAGDVNAVLKEGPQKNEMFALIVSGRDIVEDLLEGLVEDGGDEGGEAGMQPQQVQNQGVSRSAQDRGQGIEKGRGESGAERDSAGQEQGGRACGSATRDGQSGTCGGTGAKKK